MWFHLVLTMNKINFKYSTTQKCCVLYNNAVTLTNGNSDECNTVVLHHPINKDKPCRITSQWQNENNLGTLLFILPMYRYVNQFLVFQQLASTESVFVYLTCVR